MRGIFDVKQIDDMFIVLLKDKIRLFLENLHLEYLYYMSLEKYYKAYNELEVPILFIDRELVIKEFNTYSQQFFKLPAVDLNDKPFTELVFSDDISSIRRAINRINMGEKSLDYKIRFVTGKNELVMARTRFFGFRNMQGVLELIGCILHPI